MIPRRIPATVVTGFLGAGKTTLLRHLLATAHGKRLALVINEFGEIGVDRELLLGCGFDGCGESNIVELANGCLCCTVADEFLPTVERLLDRANPPDHIVIETSGLALPKPLVKAFAWPEVRGRTTVDGVIAVIDAAAVLTGRFDQPLATSAHDSPLSEVFGDQLACADLVVLNKADLLDDSALGGLRRTLGRQARPGVTVLPARFGAVDAGVLLGLDAGAEDDLGSRRSFHEQAGGNHDHDDFESFVIALAPVADIKGLTARLHAAVERHDILRLKGFVDISDRALRLAVQGVGPRIETLFDRPWRSGEKRDGTIVVIGLKGLDRAGITGLIRG